MFHWGLTHLPALAFAYFIQLGWELAPTPRLGPDPHLVSWFVFLFFVGGAGPHTTGVMLPPFIPFHSPFMGWRWRVLITTCSWWALKPQQSPSPSSQNFISLKCYTGTPVWACIHKGPELNMNSTNILHSGDAIVENYEKWTIHTKYQDREVVTFKYT